MNGHGQVCDRRPGIFVVQTLPLGLIATYKLTFLSVSFCLTAYSIPEISPYKKKSNFRILADSKIYTRQPSSPHHRNLLTQHTIRHRYLAFGGVCGYLLLSAGTSEGRANAIFYRSV
uniref:Uncharacterized protein n=1 Tax=Astatotilapia calliptera TaxID=8154 RepID=A0A3P8PRS9_ASTCA